MKVLHFYKTAFPDSMGGVEQVIHQIARGTSKLGIETDVLSLTPQRGAKTVEFSGYLVHRVHRNFEIASTGFSMSAFPRFSRLSKDADIIHYHFPWPFMDVVHFATGVKKPTIVSYHSDIIRQKNLLKVYGPLRNKFLNSVDRIVAASPNYLASSDVLAKFSDKVSIIPYGLDRATYPRPTQERLNYWRGQLGKRFFLFVGVLRYYKGLHILLEAAQGLDYPIVIMGAGPTERELKKQASQLELQNIHFLGFLPDEEKVALLTQCYSVIFPSHLRSEAFGIALLEGAIYGKPLISSEIGTGTTFVNLDKKTGLAVPPGDPEALRHAMRYLWEYPAEAKKMGRRAEERARKIFSVEQMVEKYVKLYRELTCRS